MPKIANPQIQSQHQQQEEEEEEEEGEREGEGHISGGVGGGVVGAVGTKRQRRPSVRLGDIGEGAGGGDAKHHQHYYSDHQPRRRATKQLPKPRPIGNLKSSKQTLADDVNGNKNAISNNDKKKKNYNSGSGSGSGDHVNGEDRDLVPIGSWKIRDFKSKRGVVNHKRPRSSSWCGNDKISRNFAPVNSDDEEEEDRDQLEKHHNASPNASLDSDDNDNENDVNDVIGDDVEKERERGYLKFNGMMRGVRVLDQMQGGLDDDSERNGVRVWLNKLGLGRYAPVFEIHEVDDEVLPLLTLDDLKDMGINAVGSRRKMYCSIQKLKEGS